MKYRRLLIVLFLWGSVTPVSGQTSLAGRWKVAYVDSELGVVKGKAYINEAETSARVVLSKPEVPESRYELTSTEFTRAGNKLTIVLEGPSPAARPARPSDLRGLRAIRYPESAESLEITAEGESRDLRLTSRSQADLDHVELDLEFDGEAILSGKWTYVADPVTRRDRHGGGRVGEYADASGERALGVQSGDEYWERAPTQIAGAFSLQDQTAREIPELASYRYPKRGETESRTIFVFGRNLPLEFDDPEEFESDDEAVDYRIQYRPDQENAIASAEFATGWAKLVDVVPENLLERARELDAVIVRATIGHGARPGDRDFKLNGGESTWTLAFGDTIAKVSFSRSVFSEADQNPDTPFESGHEDTDDVFLPELLTIEVRTEVAMGLDEIPIILGHNGTIIGSATGSNTWPATPVAGSDRIYRTPNLQLLGDGDRPIGSGKIEFAKDGDLLFAKLGEEGLLFVRQGAEDTSVGAAAATTRRSRTPWDTEARVRSSSRDLGTLWEDALKRAAVCQNLEQPDNWRELENAEFDRITNVIVTEWGIRSIAVKFRDMAAMILLKDEFLKLMQDAQQRIPVIQNAAQLRAFRDLVGPLMSNDSFPLSRVRIDGPDRFGVDTDYEVAFWEDYDSQYFQRYFGTDVAAARAWSDAAVQEGLQNYRESIQSSITRAIEAGDCNLEELIEITGFGFGPVAKSLIPKLMRKTGQPPRWVPDSDARAVVRGISTLAEAVRAQGDLSSVDTDVIIAAATVFFSLPAIFTSAAWAGVLAFTADAADVALTAARGGARFVEGQRELEFARGAQEIIGVSRLDDAEARAASIEGVLLETALAGVAGGLSGLDALSRLKLTRGANLLSRNIDDLAGFVNGLSKAEADDLRRLLETGATDPRQLTGIQREAFESASRLRSADGADLSSLLDRRIGEIESGELPILTRRGLTTGESPAANSGISPAEAARRAEGRLPDPEVAEGLPANLRDRVPMTVHDDLADNTVRVRYDVEDGVVTNIRMELGPAATANDVRLHEQTTRLMQRYSGLSGRVRELIRRLRRLITGNGPPPVGSRAWEAQLEIEKLPRIINDRVSRLASGPLDLSEFDRIANEVANLEAQLRQFQRTVSEIDQNPGRGFVAAEGAENLADIETRLRTDVATNRNRIGQIRAEARRLTEEAEENLVAANQASSNTQRKKRRLQAQEAVTRRSELEREARQLQQEIDRKNLELKQTRLRLDPKPRAKLPCFSPDTPVWTPHGPVPFSELKKGDLVLAFDFDSQTVIKRPILEVLKNATQHFFHIAAGGQIIKATGRHPFWVVDQNKWLHARSLRPGMTLLGVEGSAVTVESSSVQGGLESSSFNLDVEGTSNYFVGPGVLVHNQDIVDLGFGGEISIYRGTNPKFPGKVYIGQTDQGASVRQGQHRGNALKALENHRKGTEILSRSDLEFYRFMSEVTLETRVVGLKTQDQADFLEQLNMELERSANPGSLMNRRDQIADPARRAEIEARLRADADIVAAGYCPRQ